MIPRLLISSVSSSSGKTTVVSGLCALLRERGLNVCALKAGPDFIDPLFHSEASGVKSGNIDLYFTDDSSARQIFERDAKGSDFALIEGAMGFFDGLGGDSDFASAFHVARALSAPVLLVVDVKGRSLSAAAEILGIIHMAEKLSNSKADSLVCSIILNRCSKSLFERLKPKIEEICGVEVVGFLADDSRFKIESRHLGLVTPDAVEGIREKISLIASAMKDSFDVERIIAAGNQAVCEDGGSAPAGCACKRRSVTKIAVARDEAFCFYYRENLELLEDFGAELCFFSPLRNEPVPKGAAALYIGGGYPELFWGKLSENRASAESVRACAQSGVPVLAECGGFLYLQMLGIIAGTFENKNHLVRFGYAEFECEEDNFLLKKGEKIKGHEFHYFDTTENGSSFTARKSGGRKWACVQLSGAAERARKSCCQKKNAPFEKNIVAGFPHFYFPSNPRIAENFVSAALVYDSVSSSSSGASCAGCSGCNCSGQCSRAAL